MKFLFPLKLSRTFNVCVPFDPNVTYKVSYSMYSILLLITITIIIDQELCRHRRTEISFF